MNALEGIQRTEWCPNKDGDLAYGPSPRIEPLIHRVVLTGPYCTYDQLKQVGELWPYDRGQKSSYKNNFTSNISGFIRIISKWPKNSYRRPIRIELIPKRYVEAKEYKKALIDLMRALPQPLQVSEVEYAVDIYCYSPREVASLFYELIHCLWVPYKSSVGMVGEDMAQYGKNVRANHVFHAKAEDSKVKIYERGPDNRRKKGEKGWELERCDRVRIEQTAKRSKLLYHGIDTLYDLIENPKFLELNEKIFNFKKFEGSKKLPKPWEAYRSKDKYGNQVGAIQAEYLHFKKLQPDDTGYVANVSQYLNDVPEFEKLKAILIDKLREFDREWEMA